MGERESSEGGWVEGKGVRGNGWKGKERGGMGGRESSEGGWVEGKGVGGWVEGKGARGYG